MRVPTREQILDAALDVIRARGVARATTREIARSAGCAEGSLYNHFDDKGALVTCVLAERLPNFLPLVEGMAGRAGQGTVAETLTEFVRAAIAFYTELIPIIATSLADPDLRARHRAAIAEHDRGPHKTIEAVADYLRAEQQRGRLRDDIDPSVGAAVAVGACFHHAVMRLALPDGLVPVEEEAFVAGTIKTLLGGIGPGQGTNSG